jgi:hypothetical protein
MHRLEAFICELQEQAGLAYPGITDDNVFKEISVRHIVRSGLSKRWLQYTGTMNAVLERVLREMQSLQGYVSKMDTARSAVFKHELDPFDCRGELCAMPTPTVHPE